MAKYLTIKSISVLVNTLELLSVLGLSLNSNNSRKNWATQKRLLLSSVTEKQCCLTIWLILIQPLKSRFPKLKTRNTPYPCNYGYGGNGAGVFPLKRSTTLAFNSFICLRLWPGCQTLVLWKSALPGTMRQTDANRPAFHGIAMQSGCFFHS